MSKYGFDPSELIETKIDLIDKDGFHGKGTSDGGNESGGSSSVSGFKLAEGIYPVGTTTDSGGALTVMAILDLEKHPEITPEWSPVSNSSMDFYFGQKLSDDAFDMDGEMLNIQIIDENYHSYEMLYPMYGIIHDTTLLTDRFVIGINRYHVNNVNDSNPFYPVEHESESCHAAFAFKKYENNEEVIRIFQADGIWHYDPEE